MLFGGGATPKAKPFPEIEVIISNLKKEAENYKAGTPFKIDDLVKIREACGGSSGHPCIVIDVDPDAKPHFTGILGSQSNGVRYNVRILAINEGGNYNAYWLEASMLEPYKIGE